MGKLHVYTGINTAIELMEARPVGHPYLLRNHGLFIASTIHSVAPEATLHLVKVFTPNGTGSAETIAQGILQLLQMLRSPEKQNN